MEVETFMIIVLARYQLLEHPEEAGDMLSDLGGPPGDEGLNEPDQGVDVGRPLPEHGHQYEGDKLLDIGLQNLFEHGEQNLFKVGNCTRIGLADDSDGKTERLEQVVIVVRSSSPGHRSSESLRTR